MVTPLNADLTIDQNAVESLISSFIPNEVSPFLLGTTGESVSIPDKQKSVLVKSVVKHVRQRVKIYAGISGNCIQESVENAKKYFDMGIDAVVAHLPFYFPIAPEHMLRYYEQLAGSLPCPLILYNNPATVKYAIPTEIVENLSYHPNIAGIKDSERNIKRLDESLKRWSHRSDFVFLLGWTAQSAYALAGGCDGIIPSTGNLIPRLYRELYLAATSNNPEEARRLQKITDRITEIIQKDKNISQSIAALKMIMSEFGLCQPFVMPPLYQLDKAEQSLLKEQIQAEVNNLEYIFA